MSLNQIKNSKYFWVLSIFLILLGSISMSYTFLMYPSLVPIYGGGERFYLDNYNNYSTTFYWNLNTHLSITLEANNTVQIYLSNEYNGNYTNINNGTFYKIEIGPNTPTYMNLKSNFPVSGFLKFRQDPPLFLKVLSLGLTSIGIIAIFIYGFLYKSSKKRRRLKNKLK